MDSDPWRSIMSWMYIQITMCILALFVGCGGGVIRHVDDLPPPPRKTGFLLFKKMQPEVRIYLNDRFRGKVKHYPKKGMLVEIGSYLLEFRLKGYSSSYHTIKIQSHLPVHIKDKLILIPPRPVVQKSSQLSSP